MNEQQYIERQRAEHGAGIIRGEEGEDIVVEGIEYDPVEINEQEEETGIPLIVDKLKIHSAFNIDPKISMKARAVNDFLKRKSEEEGLREMTGYETIFDRLVQKTNRPLEFYVNSKRGEEILDLLFSEVAIENEMSSDSYVKLYEEEYKLKRVESLKKELKQLLSTI